jgi:hypothetical protein
MQLHLYCIQHTGLVFYKPLTSYGAQLHLQMPKAQSATVLRRLSVNRGIYLFVFMALQQSKLAKK